MGTGVVAARHGADVRHGDAAIVRGASRRGLLLRRRLRAGVRARSERWRRARRHVVAQGTRGLRITESAHPSGDARFGHGVFVRSNRSVDERARKVRRRRELRRR